MVCVGIVGAGPSGSFLAERLSAGGLDVLIFDHAMPREKPCGGLLTLRSVRAFPFLAEVGGKHPVTRMRVLSPGNREVVLESADPVYIFARKTLDTFLLGRAIASGATFFNERVVAVQRLGDGWTLQTPTRACAVDVLVGADGARSMVRQLVAGRLGRDNYRLVVGGYIPRGGGQEIFLKFLEDLPGFFWMMPRVDHAAVGIGTELGKVRARRLFSLLDRCLQRHLNCEPQHCVRRFVALTPWASSPGAFLSQRGRENAALVGDAAMLVDPISGEGIYYALKSASLLASALLEGVLGEYDSLLEAELCPALRAAAGRYSLFYDARYLSLLTVLARRSSVVRAAVEGVVFGVRGYESLPKL